MSEAKNYPWEIFPGFEIEQMAEGLNMPVNIVFREDPTTLANAYVTELYGAIKAFDHDWKAHTFAEDLLNFQPDPEIPGEGESGVTGICIDPERTGIFASMIYKQDGGVKAKVVRFTSEDGLRASSSETIIDDLPSTKKAHQIQDLTIGFDGKLYVNMGDGGAWKEAPHDVDDPRGKILRLNLDGSIPEDNPFAGSMVYAKGFRNPFGAAWRKQDRSLYVTVNGPRVDDVVTRVEPRSGHGWYPDMRRNAIFWWHRPQAPTGLDFAENGQFPPRYQGELFVALFGPSYKEGRAVKGKKIVKIRLNKDATAVKSYDEFATYVGEGPGSPCGLAFGPGGLFFTDLHEGKIYRIRPRPDYDFGSATEHVM